MIEKTGGGVSDRDESRLTGCPTSSGNLAGRLHMADERSRDGTRRKGEVQEVRGRADNKRRWAYVLHQVSRVYNFIDYMSLVSSPSIVTTYLKHICPLISSSSTLPDVCFVVT